MNIIETFNFINDIEEKTKKNNIKIKILKFYVKNENGHLVYRIVFCFYLKDKWLKVYKSLPISFTLDQLVNNIIEEAKSKNDILDILDE